MNGPPDLPTDRIPLPMPGVPEPAVPLPPVRTPVAAEPTPDEPAAVAGATVGPAPQPRWVKEAVRDMLTPNRKKLVVLSTAGSVVAVGLALNALFTGAGLAPEPPRQEQSAEPKSLAAASTEPPEQQTRESTPAVISGEPQPVQPVHAEPVPVPYAPPPDLRTPTPPVPPATGGVLTPDIPVVPAPVPPVGGSGTFIEPAPIITAAHSDQVPGAPAPSGEVNPPAALPAPSLPTLPTIEPKPATPTAQATDIKPPEFKPLEVAPPAAPVVGATRPDEKKDEPAARLDPKGVQPVALPLEAKTPADPKPQEKKESGSVLPPPMPWPAEGAPAPTRTTPAAGQVAAPGDLPAGATTPAEGGRPPEPKDMTPAPPVSFQAVPAAGDDRPAGGSLNLTEPPGEPGVRPAGNAEPPKTDFDVDLHKPKAGDTYESISKLHYRDARYAEALRQFNRGVELDRGVDVQVPPMYVLRQRFPQQVGAPRGSAGGPEWTPPVGRERK